MKRAFRQVVIAGIVIGLASAGYFAYARWGRPEALPEGLIQANGRVEGDHITVACKFPGRIQAVLVREGASVEAEQVLVRLDDTQARAKTDQARRGAEASAAQARAAKAAREVLEKEVPLDIAVAEAGVEHARAVVARQDAATEQARRDAQRFHTLAERGSVTTQQGEQAELSLTVARDEVTVARTALTRAERQLSQAKLGPDRIRARREEEQAAAAQHAHDLAALAEAESVLDDLVVRAASPGVIMTRVVEPGEVVAAGSPLLDMVDLDRLYLKVYVPEVEIGKLRIGLPALVYTDAYPDRPFPATVREIATRAEFTPKEVQTVDERVKLVYAVKLYFDANPEHRLTPGMPADAVIRWKEESPWGRPRW
jgi:HlyD family secretion protein